jgi:hypothetical protein
MDGIKLRLQYVLIFILFGDSNVKLGTYLDIFQQRQSYYITLITHPSPTCLYVAMYPSQTSDGSRWNATAHSYQAEKGGKISSLLSRFI